jgi:ABC-type Fe3+/spermidine/putrescine transport system ATPase subunit
VQGHITIRPEAVQIVAQSAQTLPANLVSLRDLGEVSRARAVLHSGVVLEISVPSGPARHLHQGQQVHLDLPPHALWFIPQGADE